MGDEAWNEIDSDGFGYRGAPPAMLVVGTIGGIACGKSTVTQLLVERGAVALDADRVGHEVLKWEPVKAQIFERWGDAVFSTDGEVDRKKLAKVVFDPLALEELAFLETVTHPMIGQRLHEQIDQIRTGEATDGERPPMVVLDAAIMVKTGWSRFCDELIFIDASYETRLGRARLRGWSKQMFDRRESSQTLVKEKREFSTRQLNNNSTHEHLVEQVQLLWDLLTNQQQNTF